MRYAGAAFLIFYGGQNLWSALTSNERLLPSSDEKTSLSNTLLICLAFTWLNPHVYLDTVVLIGSISTQYEDHHLLFITGTSLASVVFFFSLGYGAALLRPLFARAVAWKILDGLVGLTMWVIAASLIKIH